MTELDVRPIPPREKHQTIYATFRQLAVGDTLRLINDHDPRPLRFEFDHDFPGTFSWVYVEQGPQIWRVDIGKTAELKG